MYGHTHMYVHICVYVLLTNTLKYHNRLPGNVIWALTSEAFKILQVRQKKIWWFPGTEWLTRWASITLFLWLYTSKEDFFHLYGTSFLFAVIQQMTKETTKNKDLVQSTKGCRYPNTFATLYSLHLSMSRNS